MAFMLVKFLLVLFALQLVDVSDAVGEYVANSEETVTANNGCPSGGTSTVLVSNDAWNSLGCGAFLVISCTTELGGCKGDGYTATVQVVGTTSDDTFTVSSDAFETIAEEGYQQIDISYEGFVGK